MENDNQFTTQSRNSFWKNFQVNFCIAVKTVYSIHIGQKFEDYQAFESAIERYQSAESLQFYKRDSRAVQKAKPCVKKDCRAVDRTRDLLF